MSKIIEVKVFLPDSGLLISELERLAIDVKKLSQLPPITTIGNADIKRDIHALHRKGKLSEYSVEDYFITEKEGFSFSFSDSKKVYSLEDIDNL